MIIFIQRECMHSLWRGKWYCWVWLHQTCPKYTNTCRFFFFSFNNLNFHIRELRPFLQIVKLVKNGGKCFFWVSSTLLSTSFALYKCRIHAPDVGKDTGRHMWHLHSPMEVPALFLYAAQGEGKLNTILSTAAVAWQLEWSVRTRFIFCSISLKSKGRFY